MAVAGGAENSGGCKLLLASQRTCPIKGPTIPEWESQTSEYCLVSFTHNRIEAELKGAMASVLLLGPLTGTRTWAD